MISVCIATYNGERYIKKQLESILSQLGSNDEVIISDDGSDDGTINEINKLNDVRIRIVLNKHKHGFTHNFENAIAESKGDYIFLADQDDIWLENKVSTMLEGFQTANLVISDCTTVDSQLNVIQQSRFKAFNIKPGFVRHLFKSRYLGCCLAFDAKMKNTILPFPKLDQYLEHDIWIVAVGFLYFKVKLIDEQLILYRRHGNNTSEGGFEKGYTIPNKIVRRMYRLYCLLRIFPKARRMK